ncbi:hypothetical protein DIPPA_24632 [Diplonema papillatum]|nr:hypothetical protein DIPPA_24632 [Diplonema papillatum]
MIIDPAADAHASTAADRAIKRAVFRKQNNACFVRKLDCKVALAVLKQVRWSRRPRKNSKVQPRRRSPSPGMLNSARTPPDSALHALHHPREPLSLALHRPPSTAAATSAAAALAAQPSNSGPLLSNYRPLMTPDSPLGNAAKMRILRSPSSGRGSRTPR